MISWLGQRRNSRRLKNEFPVRDSDKGDEKGRQDHAHGQDFDHVFEEHESGAEEVEEHGVFIRDYVVQDPGIHIHLHAQFDEGGGGEGGCRGQGAAESA